MFGNEEARLFAKDSFFEEQDDDDDDDALFDWFETIYMPPSANKGIANSIFSFFLVSFFLFQRCVGLVMIVIENIFFHQTNIWVFFSFGFFSFGFFFIWFFFIWNKNCFECKELLCCRHCLESDHNWPTATNCLILSRHNRAFA